MKISQSSFLNKTNSVITTVVRNTSCNRGWLQLFTHAVCGTFTAASFVLILLITLQVFERPVARSRCRVSSCRVICQEAPYYEGHEDDIILAAMEAETSCQNIFLSLHRPTFSNESLPENWLARLRPNVKELSIIGGNLRHIPANVFSSPFARHVHILLLENVTISSWTQYTLAGLANLENLLIKNCNIIELQENALKVVSQTLEALTVIRSGHFDPKWLTGLVTTGLPQLTTVDFTSNFFGSILGNTSFSKLRFCKSLYLSSNRISYIGPGAFDRLIHIEYLNLNKNYLQTLEPGLFTMITLNNRASINLVDNLWHCDCGDRDLRRLIEKGVLLSDPICSSPSDLRGKTFTEYHNYCKTKEPRKVVVVDIPQPRVIHVKENETIYSMECANEQVAVSDLSPVLVSPFKSYECSMRDIDINRLRLPSVPANIYDNEGAFWIKPTLVITGTDYAMIELGSSGLKGYGLVWYRSLCPNEIFCVNVVPEVIRFYNMNLTNHYTFCPMKLKSWDVDTDQCITYTSTDSKKPNVFGPWLTYTLIAVTCLLFGAVFLYFLIRQYPALLRGSKRLLFVKHKTVDALVLPPKVPLRSSLLCDDSMVKFNDMRVAEPLRSDFAIGQFARSDSIRSGTSYAPSYISALQPSDEQLASWRQKHGTDKYDGNYSAISIISSEMTPISTWSGSDNLYFSLDGSSNPRSISISNS